MLRKRVACGVRGNCSNILDDISRNVVYIACLALCQAPSEANETIAARIFAISGSFFALVEDGGSSRHEARATW
ncbi:MAG: hypothetical protein ACXWID_09605 [Pyrinomonadaceae bacterium]